MFAQIISFSIKYKSIVAFLVAVMVGLGIWSMMQIPIDAVPDITNNQVQVVTSSPSLSPQEVEKFITYPLEVTMANIKDVIEIRSISRYGLSVVTIVFKDRVPILDARQLVNEQIGMAISEIPAELGTPEMLPITTGLGEVYQYTLQVDENFAGQYDAMELRTLQDWIVKRQLSGIPGIVEISSFGGFLKQYEISVDPVRLKSFGLTITDIHEAVSKNNQNTGGSYIEKGPYAFYIRAEGLVEELSDLEEIVIKTVDGMPVLLNQVATLRYGHAPRFGAMTANGNGEAVGGITLMLKGANSSEVIRQVKERIERVEESLPPGIKIVPYLDRAELVSKTIHTVAENLILGGLLVILVLVLLLGNLRTGLIVASVIPLSLLFSFIMMNLFGVSANLMSLGAIDFGIVIDGAVIIVESIMHQLYKKHRNKIFTRDEMDEVITKSATSIYKSAGFGVIIILIVFIPIMTLTGIEGKTFKPMAQTFSFAILGAFILSLTYVPMMAALIMKRNIVWKETFSDKIIKFLKLTYHPVLRLSLRYRTPILLTTLVVVIFTAFIYSRMGGEFLPTLEEGDLAMQMTIPPGSSLSQSVLQTTRAERILLDNFPEVEQVVSKIGTAEVPTDPMAVEDADIMIVLKEKDEWVSARTREELISLMKEKLETITAASFEFTQPIQLRFNELMTGVKTDIAVKIYGEDIDELYRAANRAASLIEGMEGASDVKVEQISGLPQYVIKYDRHQVAQYGLNIEELNTIVRTSFAGEAAGVIFEGERKFDLVVRLDSNYRKGMDLTSIFARSSRGVPVPLSEVASMEYIEGPLQISRDDTKRRVTIGINVRNRDVKSLVLEINKELSEKLVLKAGYYLTYGGQFENLENALKRLKVAVPIALILILILLFFTFNSVKYALLIFTAVPLSAVGGVLALWVRGMPFSISAGVGFIALFGVAVLNGIVLISYYNDLRKDGVRNINFIIIQGASTRLRPVLLTAVTDILGFLPMAISISAGAEVQRPLATVVIGGLITSTMLTLIILPILYSMMNRQKPPTLTGTTPPTPDSPLSSGSPEQGQNQGRNQDLNQIQNQNQGRNQASDQIQNPHRRWEIRILGGRFKPALLLFLALIALLVLLPRKGKAQDDPPAPVTNLAVADLPATLILTQDEAVALARDNNLVLRNAELELESARVGKRSVFDLDQTEFRYSYGQLNSSLDDRLIELEQNFGSILTHVQKSGYVKQQIEAKQSSLLLTQAELDRSVKAIYQYWLYHYHMMNLTSREHDFYSRLVAIAKVQYENGETSLLEKSLVETRFAGVQNELRDSERMYFETGTLLQEVLQVAVPLVPGDTVFSRVDLIGEADLKENTLIDRYYDNLYQLEMANVKLEKSRFFPGLSAMYFNQTIDEVVGFSGFQVGMTFPLWFVPQGGRIKQARLQSEIARNEMLVQVQKRDRSVENLKEKLRSYDKQIKYYEETALQSSETLFRTATLKLEQQGIEYFEFIASISVALDIQREYLDQLNRYNQAAIELEYLLK
ncbi:CusA/CzcA family heavy metal efflux RND transporter [Bacteroidota bacterium]